jgi:acyl-CoA reductase-like NAD-dependent aldehyde dehydrogenase
MPFGGFKESGIGREGAMGARSFYTEEKTVAIALANPILPKLGGHKGE